MAADFCTWNPVRPKPVPHPEPPDGFFRVKLYWEQGYLWQNETVEREWCMISEFDGYPGDGYVSMTYLIVVSNLMHAPVRIVSPLTCMPKFPLQSMLVSQ